MTLKKKKQKTDGLNGFSVLGGAHHVACRILVPLPGIAPTSPAVEAQSLHHWTTREVGGCCSVAKSCLTLSNLQN